MTRLKPRTYYLILFVILITGLRANAHGHGKHDSDSKESSQEDSKQLNTKTTPTKLGSPHKIAEMGLALKKHEEGWLDISFIHAFVASLSVIIVSELGDKTFFIAAIMAMRHPRLTVFLGAMAALGLMTVLSALLGYATTVIPRWFTNYVSAGLFVIFGIKMLREGYLMSPDEGKEEYEEVQADLRRKDEEVEKQTTTDVETGIIRTPQRRYLYSLFSRILIQSFTMTFLAEWGDRSQIATIILAAREDVIGVVLGGILGHALCTGLAVLGGRMVAQTISMRTVTILGGCVFLAFAISAFVIDPYE